MWSIEPMSSLRRTNRKTLWGKQILGDGNCCTVVTLKWSFEVSKIECAIVSFICQKSRYLLFNTRVNSGVASQNWPGVSGSLLLCYCRSLESFKVFSPPFWPQLNQLCVYILVFLNQDLLFSLFVSSILCGHGCAWLLW